MQPQPTNYYDVLSAGLPYGQPMGQQQQQPQIVYVVQQQPQQQQQTVSTPVGRFAPHVHYKVVKPCGDLLITLGTLAITGAILEVITFPIFRQSDGLLLLSISVTSYNSYAGFWCGALMIVGGSLTTSASGISRRNDSMFIAMCVGSVDGLVFSIVLLAQSANALNGMNGEVITYYKMMHAAYGIMIACGSIGLPLSLIIIIVCVIAFINGFKDS